MVSDAPINASDFGAVGDGVTDDTAAIQAAIDVGIAEKKTVLLQGKTYLTSSTLTLTGRVCLVGDGIYATIIKYTGAASAVVCAQFTGVVSNLGVVIQNNTANGVELGSQTRNAVLENLYVQATAVGATHTGYGIYFNAGTGQFSGLVTLQNIYVLQCFHCIHFEGIDQGQTWTTVFMSNVRTTGNTAISPPRAGTCGIYMDGNTNGIGTCLYGGAIEWQDYGVYVEDGSKGGLFEAAFEGNNNLYFIGNTFSGHITNSNEEYYRQAVLNSTVTWERIKIGGGQTSSETYYAPSSLVYTGGGESKPVNFYRNNVSVINGGALEANALKFGFGTGLTGFYGSSVHPSQHYVQVSNSKLHWGNDIPSARAGAQLVAWVRGDVCYNLSATVGQPIGWMCTVAGTPGTWVAMANL